MRVGIIGGSGLYHLEELEGREEIHLETPFGKPSSSFVTGEIHGVPVAFLPRHGIGHVLMPTEIPFRANIWGLKKLGVTHLISVGAVGSLKEEIAPGHMVFPDQFIDLTRHRSSTFFGNGLVGHVQFGDPVCAMLSSRLVEAANKVGATVHERGTYICMEGPAFSSRAESELYRSWGASVIGMTNAQEAKLAREAEMAFASISLATDYDCWHEDYENVTVNDVIETLHKNVELAKVVIKSAAELIPEEKKCSCGYALDNSIITDTNLYKEAVNEKTKLLLERYLK